MENKKMTMEAFGQTYTVKSYAQIILKNAENKKIRYQIENLSILDLALQDIDDHISWYPVSFFEAVKKEIQQITYGK